MAGVFDGKLHGTRGPAHYTGATASGSVIVQRLVEDTVKPLVVDVLAMCSACAEPHGGREHGADAAAQ